MTPPFPRSSSSDQHTTSIFDQPSPQYHTTSVSDRFVVLDLDREAILFHKRYQERRKKRKRLRGKVGDIDLSMGMARERGIGGGGGGGAIGGMSGERRIAITGNGSGMSPFSNPRSHSGLQARSRSSAAVQHEEGEQLEDEFDEKDEEEQDFEEVETESQLRRKWEQWADNSDGESTFTDDSSSAGLGINFYDHNGVGRRSVMFEKVKTKDLERRVFGIERQSELGGEDEEPGLGDGDQDEENDYEALDVQHQQPTTIAKIDHKKTYAKQLNSNGRNLRAQYQHQEQETPSLNTKTPRAYQASPQPLKSPDSNLELLTPKLLEPIPDPDWNHDSPIDLIDQLLEQNYREQAETFVRIASRETPVRALSTSKRAVSSSTGSGSQPGSRSRSGHDREKRRRSVLGLSASPNNGDSTGDGSDIGSGLGLGLSLGTATVDKTVEVPEVDPPSQSPSAGRAGSVPSNTETNDETSSSSSEPLIIFEDQFPGAKETGSLSEQLSSNLQVRNGQKSTLTRSISSSSSLSIPVQPLSKIQRASNLRAQRTGSGFSPSISVPPSRSPSSPSNLGTSPFTLRQSGNTSRVPLHLPSKPTIVKRSSQPQTSSATAATAATPTSKSRPASQLTRGPEYFTSEERLYIARLVHAKARSCDRHTNCTVCIDLEFAYYENKFLPRSMDADQRQKIINNNRSLRNIKNELESLAEHGAISDEVYDTIMAALPAESSLAASARSNLTPVQAQAQAPAPVQAPTNAFNNMRLNDPPPPAYTTPAAPSLPNRAPSAPPAKPEIARATALYRYAEPDDCTFEPGDQIAVHEYMNNDWWLGRNLRTGKEGVFPVNYVQVIPSQPQGPPSMHGAYGNEKSNYNNAYPGQYQQQQGPPPPGPSNPYNSSVPPMAIAEEPSKAGKGQEMGKKFGKKLGNAAIFGAGATIGGNIVNSIF